MTLLKSAALFFTDAPAPPPSSGPYHSFIINVGNGGYNAVLGRGSVSSGSASYDEPGGRTVTVVHCRNVRGELNFALSGATSGTGRKASEFPSRIVATKTTGGEASITLTPQGESLRDISGAVRQDYDPATGESNAVGDVFVNGQTVTIDLYYDPVEVAGSATLTFPNANSVRSELTDANGIRSVQLCEFILPGGSALNANPVRLSDNVWRGEVPLGTFGQWSVTWTYTDGIGSGKSATARGNRSL